MRVLHVFDHSVPLHSGYSFRSLAILRAQRRLGWETFHLTGPRQGDAGGEADVVEDFEFYRTRPPRKLSFHLPLLNHARDIRAIARRLQALVPQLHPDVIHAHSPALNGYAALGVARRFGIPLVYEVRAFWEDAAVDHGTAKELGLRYRLARNLESRVLRGADAVTVICEGLRDEIIGRGVSENKVTVIPNAVALDHFGEICARDTALARANGLDGAVVIGFVGSMYGYEGVPMLVEALKEVIAAEPRAKLLLVGGGPDESQVRARVASLGLADKVVLVGRVPHSEVPRYYDLVDIFAYPRKRMRLTDLVTPLKPLEAMASGRLVAASDVGGHRELIRDGETGVLFAADDVGDLARKLIDLIRDPDRWQPMRQAARRFVEQERTWDRSVARYGPVYAGLVK
jgi:PEP-CTERM/exosortase A-associated glycosyltransferase